MRANGAPAAASAGPSGGCRIAAASSRATSPTSIGPPGAEHLGEVRLEGVEVGRQRRFGDAEGAADRQRLLVVPRLAGPASAARSRRRTRQWSSRPGSRGPTGESSGSSALYRPPWRWRAPGSRTEPRIPRCSSCRRRISSRAAGAVPYTIRRYERRVPDRRAHGSSRKSECSATPAATSGCATCMSSARGPAPSRSIASRLSRHASLPGP